MSAGAEFIGSLRETVARRALADEQERRAASHQRLSEHHALVAAAYRSSSESARQLAAEQHCCEVSAGEHEVSCDNHVPPLTDGEVKQVRQLLVSAASAGSADFEIVEVKHDPIAELLADLVDEVKRLRLRTDVVPAARERDSGGERDSTAAAAHPTGTEERSESQMPRAAGTTWGGDGRGE